MSPKLLNVLLVLAPVMLYNFVYLPLTTGEPSVLVSPEASISSLQSTRVQYINNLNLISEIQTSLKRINDDYKSVDPASSTKAELMLPDKIDQLKLRREVINIADAAGVALKDVSVKEDKGSNAAVGSYLVDFSFVSRYKEAKLLLGEYEKNKRFYTIESLTIKRMDTKSLKSDDIIKIDKDSLTISVTYRVNYLK